AAMGRLLMRVRPQLFHIDVDAQTGTGRQVDPAVLHRQRGRRNVAAQILEIHEILGDAEIRDHRRDVYRRGQADERAVVVVRRHYHRLGLRHGCDVEHSADPANDADVRVQDVGRAFGETLEERLAGIDRLAGDDRARHGAAYLGHQLDILRQARLLVPVDPELSEAMADADRVRGSKATV